MNPISSSDLVIVKDPTQIQEGAESLTTIPSVDKCATEEALGHLKVLAWQTSLILDTETDEGHNEYYRDTNPINDGILGMSIITSLYTTHQLLDM